MSKDNSDFFKIKNEWSIIKDRLLIGDITVYLLFKPYFVY